MNLIDEQYLETPFYGARKIAYWLRKIHGILINRKRVRRLMLLMGIEVIYQKPRTSQPAPKYNKYPYLLKGLEIVKPQQVWASDITYIRMRKGFLYLVAIMDWFSRYVLSWQLSNTMEDDFCVEALKVALELGQPEIFNTDQGSQFTGTDFIDVLKNREIKISMDGKGRFMDNIFTERLWRSLKYEEVYLNAYESMKEAKAGIGKWFYFYNYERLHQALDYQTPYEVHSGKPMPLPLNYTVARPASRVAAPPLRGYALDSDPTRQSKPLLAEASPPLVVNIATSNKMKNILLDR